MNTPEFPKRRFRALTPRRNVVGNSSSSLTSKIYFLTFDSLPRQRFTICKYFFLFFVSFLTDTRRLTEIILSLHMETKETNDFLIYCKIAIIPLVLSISNVVIKLTHANHRPFLAALPYITSLRESTFFRGDNNLLHALSSDYNTEPDSVFKLL